MSFFVGASKQVARDSTTDVGDPDELRLACDEEGSLKDGLDLTEFLTETISSRSSTSQEVPILKGISDFEHATATKDSS